MAISASAASARSNSNSTPDATPPPASAISSTPAFADLAQKNHLPAICPYRDYVDSGVLMGYTVDLAELLRRMADDVHKILHGAKPGDFPIYQATKFQLLINLKTAKALGLTLPPALLARADEIIE